MGRLKVRSYGAEYYFVPMVPQIACSYRAKKIKNKPIKDHLSTL